MFEKDSPYAGKVTAYDSPIYIADAALYLMNTQPDLGHQEPLRPRRGPARRGGRAAQDPAARRSSEYWSDYLKEMQAFTSGDTVIGTTWQVIANLAEGEKVPVEAILPERGLHRLVGHLDGQRASRRTPTAPTRGWTTSPSPEANAAVAEYFGEAPANAKACDLTADKGFCDTYHAADEAYADKIWYWTTPIEQCLDGRTDVDVHRLRRVDPGLDRDQGLSVGLARPASCTAARGSGSGCCSRHRCCGWAWPTSGPWRRCS